MAPRCPHRIAMPSPTSLPAGPKPSGDISGAATYWNAEIFSYHSCKNRSCPKYHTDQTQVWLERRRAEMLPAPYLHVIVTVPEELRLRHTLRSNQRDGYSVLLKATAEAIIELADDRRFTGGTVGVLAVLHTWTQQLLYTRMSIASSPRAASRPTAIIGVPPARASSSRPRPWLSW
jgi:hypothetical protein